MISIVRWRLVCTKQIRTFRKELFAGRRVQLLGSFVPTSVDFSLAVKQGWYHRFSQSPHRHFVLNIGCFQRYKLGLAFER